MIRNLLASLTGLMLLILGLMFSMFVLVVISALGLAAWAYLWWKTRKLRRAMEQQAGQVIDGEAVLVEEPGQTTAPKGGVTRL